MNDEDLRTSDLQGGEYVSGPCKIQGKIKSVVVLKGEVGFK
ncbi:MAG: hypothetical protein ACP5NO_05500 [Thermoplasmata archaeon]